MQSGGLIAVVEGECFGVDFVDEKFGEAAPGDDDFKKFFDVFRGQADGEFFQHDVARQPLVGAFVHDLQDELEGVEGAELLVDERLAVVDVGVEKAVSECGEDDIVSAGCRASRAFRRP